MTDFGIEVDGIEDVKEKLEQLVTGVEVSDEFVQQRTEFESWEELRVEAPFSDLSEGPSPNQAERDAFMARNTDFSDEGEFMKGLLSYMDVDGSC